MSESLGHKPAFPYAFQHEEDGRFISQGFAAGMSLRQYYAGLAMQGLWAHPDTPYDRTHKACDLIADAAVRTADALLERLETK